MVKKKRAKGKNARNDSRGYGQTTTTTTPVAPKEVKTHNVQDILEQLSALIKPDTATMDPPMPLHPADVVRFRRKLEATHDALLAYGFRYDQIEAAIASLGARILDDDKACLDWLCLMLPVDELPFIFTEGEVREQLKEKDVTLEVMVAKQNDQTVPESASLPTFPALPTPEDKQMDAQTLEKEQSDLLEMKKRKEWIMSQYQYDDSDEDGEQMLAASETMVAEAKQQVVDSQSYTVDSESAEEQVEDPILTSMRSELAELQEDAANDANNYMRSKQEIKDLQKRIKTLKSQVSKLEAKQAKKKSKPRFDQQIESEEEECPPVDLFGSAEEPDTQTCNVFASTGKEGSDEPLIVAEQDIDLQLPADCIPKSWTGSTPRQILDDYCKQNRVERPKIRPLNRTEGCRLSILKLGIEMQHNVGAFATLQHYLAVRALYEIDSSSQLYIRYPPFFRDIWHKWQVDAKAEKEANVVAVEAEKRKVIDALMSLVSIQTVTKVGGETNKKLNSAASQKHQPGHSSDDDWGPAGNPIQRRDPTSNGTRLQLEWTRHTKESEKYQLMLKSRRELPIHSFRQQILDLVENNSVTILCAETGSGKTTQCSSFILEDALSTGYGDRVSILCTQPRRVAALSVAERVSEELGENDVGGLVGYSIRLESRKSPSTRLLFCTTGIILRRLVDDPKLVGISHLVLDEVHERQWQIDILFTCVRQLLRTTRPDLKVILMSATLDKQLFSKFFDGAPVIDVPGRTFPVTSFYLEDLVEETGYVVEEGSRFAHRNSTQSETVSLMITGRGGEKRRETADYQIDADVSGRFGAYSMATQISMDRVNETIINYDLIEQLLEYLCIEKSTRFHCDGDDADLTSGAVLIFLPGVGEISALVDRLKATRLFGNDKTFKILPLHSAVSSSQQKEAFKIPGKGCRKIVVSTNIAETSVTIPDVVYVIDSGRVREIIRDKRSGARRLVATWISKASAKQRSGRAGRVRPGCCFKLFSSDTEESVLKANTDPELHRIPLEEVCLAVLASNLATDCREFLSNSLEPPPADAVDAAFDSLHEIGAVSFNEAKAQLTPLGHHLAQLSVDARLGKMLIYGAIFGCVDPILTIVSALSASKSPFLSSSNASETKAAHAQFLDPDSDYRSYVNVWNAFAKALAKGGGRSFCREMYLNYASLQEMKASRFQFADLLHGLGFLCFNKTDGQTKEEMIQKCKANRFGNLETLIDNVVCAGLFPNVGKLEGKPGNDAIVVHRTERLFVSSPGHKKIPSYQKSEWLAFYEKFGTERRTMVSCTTYINPLCLLLFGSSIDVDHAKRRTTIDGWMQLNVAAKTAMVFKEIKQRLSDYLRRAIDSRKSIVDIDSDHLIDLVATLLSK